MKKVLVMILIALMILPGCSDKKETLAEYQKISPEEAKNIMDTEEVVILDVRTDAEFAEYHIEGAILIPDTDLEALAPEKLPDKSQKILVYCRSGRRSEASARLLIQMGYTAIYDFGGIIDWTYETVTGN